MEWFIFLAVMFTLMDTKSVGKWAAEVHAWYNHFQASATKEVMDTIDNPPKSHTFRNIILIIMIVAIVAFLVI